MSGRRSGRAGRSARTDQRASQGAGRRESSRRTSSRMPSGRGQQRSQQTVIIAGAAIGAVVIILGGALLMGGSGKGTRPSAPVASGGRMTPEEARRLKSEGKAELARGEALYRQAGSFGSPGYAAKVNEARGHLNRAMESFNRIPDYLGDPELEALSTQCGRLLSACFKVPIDTH